MPKTDLRSLTKKELLDLARDRDVAGRSKMDKDELIAALERGPGSPGRAHTPAGAPTPARGPRASAPETPARSATPVERQAETSVPAQARVRNHGSEAESARPLASGPARENVEAGADPARQTGERVDRHDRHRERPHGERSGHTREHDDDSDPWNRIDAADPNYGRFLNPRTAEFRRGKDGGRGGRFAGPNGPNGPSGRPGAPSGGKRDDAGRGRTGDRAQQARDVMRKSGEARQGVGYTPMFDRQQRDEGRSGPGRSRRSRRREERRRRKNEMRGQQGAAPPSGTRDAERAPAASPVGLPRVWREDGGRREEVHKQRGEKRRDEDGVPGGEAALDVRDNDQRRGEERHVDRRAGRGDDRSDRAKFGRAPERPSTPSLDALGVIGPVDPNELEKELRSLAHRNAAQPASAKEPQERGPRPESRCRVLPRDPYWIHVFWEVDPAQVSRTAKSLGAGAEELRWVLRVHSLPREASGAGRAQPPGFFDVEVLPTDTSTYVHVGIPDRDYRVDVGLLTDRGLFCPLASSNRARTPRDTIESQETATPPEGDDAARRLYEQSGGSPAGRIERGPLPVLQRDLEASRRSPERKAPGRGGEASLTPRVVRGEASGPRTAKAGEAPASRGSTSASGQPAPPDESPEGWQRREDRAEEPANLPSAVRPAAGASPHGPTPWTSSPGARAAQPWTPIGARPTVQGPMPPADRGFWLTVQTELVVSGATDPDATLTIQGIPIPLRADGTFTVRFELPDGEQIVPVVAVSGDGRFEREITPHVHRSTTRSERTRPPAAGNAEADRAESENGTRNGRRRRRRPGRGSSASAEGPGANRERELGSEAGPDLD